MKSNLYQQFALSAAIVMAAATAQAADIQVKLSGDQEIPAVQTSASGWGTISVNADKSISGSITTKDVKATAAHIHAAPPGKSGPPVVSLVANGDNGWAVPAGTKLTDEQYAAFQSGQFYINVHSAEHKPGEIRGALKP
jgi:hypothetical protein